MEQALPDRRAARVVVEEVPTHKRAIELHARLHLDERSWPEIRPRKFLFARPHEADRLLRCPGEARRFDGAFTGVFATVARSRIRHEHAHLVLADAERARELRAHTKRTLRARPHGQFAVFPVGQRGARLIVRAALDDSRLLARISETIRREALTLEPGLRTVTARPLDDVISPQLRAWRLGAGLFSAFGLLALAVAGVGLYSVVAFDVEGRRREIGVRAALGASRGTILRMVLADAFRLMAIGMALGSIGVLFAARAIRHMFYGVSTFDPLTVAGTAVLLIVVALAASIWPARRAASVDPIQAIRAD